MSRVRIVGRLGVPRPTGTAPVVDFAMRDNTDRPGRPVTVATVREDYYIEDPQGRRPVVYMAFVPVAQMPDAYIVESGNPRFKYDWAKLMSAQVLPPVKLVRWTDGKLEIIDGNHRVALWRKQGFQFIPAYVLDLVR